VITHYRGGHSHQLVARLWRRDDPIADVIDLHGIVSHGGWYESSGSHLARHGFRVHFLDRRGSGLNPDARGDVDDWTTWLADVIAYVDQLSHAVPRILLGISWGGILATALSRQFPDRFDGLGLICPGLFSHKAASPVQRMALHAAFALGLGDFRVPIPLQDPALFTRSARHQNYIARDPLSLRSITIRFGLANLKLLRQAIEAPEELHLPVLLMLASDDPITDNERTRAFVGRIGHHDRTVIEYAGASHTLEFEADPSAYFRDLTAWCRRIADAASG
jgi:alpha-beta hydrolase superfamily lysophospholipase